MKDQSSTQPITTPQPNDTSTADATVKPAEPPSRAPESYTFKAPDGKEFDKSIVDRATPIFRELNLDQAAAQRLVDIYLDLSKSRDDATMKAVGDMRAEWREQIGKDPEIGGKLETVKADIGRMKDAIFKSAAERTAFDAAMDLTGAGDNLAIIKAWHRASAAFREGSHVSGSSPSPEGQRAPGDAQKPSLAQAMYPNLPH